jgi:hypothetical protein
MNSNPLIAAAIAGMLLGGVACSSQSASTTAEGSAPATAAPAGGEMPKHACKGQNECKGQGGCKTDGT